MDLDGLEQLMKANHKATMDAIQCVEGSFREQRVFCHGRFKEIEEDIESHERTISKSKGIITVLGSIWAATTTTAALVAPYFWR